MRKYGSESEVANRNISPIFSFLDKNTGRIEVVNQVGKLETVYFPKLPYCIKQNSDKVEQFMDDVDRDTAMTRCNALAKERYEIMLDLKIDFFLSYQIFKLLGLIPRNVSLM